MSEITTSKKVEDLNKMLEVLKDYQEFKQEKWPVRSNYASKAGHPCERYLYYMRHDWDKASTRNWGGVGILGNLIADWWKIYMMKKGFKLIHDQIPLSDELSAKYQIGGRIDGRIGWGDISPIVYELKTMDRNYYDKFNTYEDFANAKQDYIRGYPAQLQLYLLSLGEEVGMFILVNKQTLAWKMIPVHLDYEYCEWILKRLERVNKANVEGIPPERISYSSTCKKCEYQTICMQDIVNEEIEFEDNETLELLINTMEETRENYDRYKDSKEEADAIVKNKGKGFILGQKYMVEIKKTEGSRIDTKLIPKEEAAKYKVQTSTIKISYRPLGQSKLT